MMTVLVGLFTTGIILTGWQRLLLMLPLCLSIAIVYKTLRLENPRELPSAVLVLWGTIVAGMCAVGVGLWLLFEVLM